MERAGPKLGAKLVLLAFLAVTGAELCLPEGIPQSERVYLDGNQSIHIKMHPWRAALGASKVAEIIISEVLGYHTAVDQETILPFSDAMATFACSDTDCQTRHGKTDILLDVWGISDTPQFFADWQLSHPQVVEDLGSMGYASSWGLFLKGSVLEHAQEGSGLFLDYYKSYNLSFNQPHRYFDTLWDWNASELVACTAEISDFMNSAEIKNFLDWTGDVEGVRETNGRYSAHCLVPGFWIAPACRHNYAQCISTFLFQGWGYGAMQWAVAHGIPLALTYLYGAGSVQQIRKHRLLYAWYAPDDTFADLRPAQVILPEHRPKDWARGDYRTGSPKGYVGKLGSTRMRITAPQVRAFVQKMEVDEDQTLGLMAAVGEETWTQVEKWRGAQQGCCEWLKANRDVWTTWLPVATDCTEGFGIADIRGMPVMSLAEAVNCQICPAGTFSELYEDGGFTYRCQPCNPGYHQTRAGQISCIPCNPGTHSADAGQAFCSPCSRGSFMNLSAATSCFPCGPSEAWTTSKAVEAGEQERWIEIEGAISEDLCHCVQGRYLSGDHCELCMEGSSCPGSGVLQVLPGFYSSPGDPGRLLKCFGTPLRCPGGLPGTCAAGWDPDSVSCSACLPGMQPAGEECVPCTGGDYLAVSLVGALGLLLPAALHIQLTISDKISGSYFGRLLGAALCMSQLITCAQLFSVIEQIQGITWREPFVSFLQLFGVLSLQTLLESLKTVGCVARISLEMEFLIRTLVVPLLFTVGPVVAHLVMIKLRLAQRSSDLVKTLGFLMQLFFISLCSSFLEPFRCNVHPNGLLTMQTAHGVVCNFSDTHLTLCWMSGLVCLLPVTFLVLCTWVLLVVLPGRAQAADVNFLRACSFLILRFKPGYETFTIAFLLRNLLFVLTPMMQSASLFVMGNLLAAAAVSVAYFKPWRSDLSSQVDVLVNWVLLVVLLLGSLTVDDFADSETTGLMILCTVCGCCLTFAIVLAAMYSLVKHIASKFRKKYAFFLSHHKIASAGFARLLKMELKRCGSGYTSFIDADDLTDLSRLFSYINNDTQTFVLLATPRVLERKWCAGELTMARLARVDTVLLTFPGFAFPDDQFIRNYTRLVPDIKDLVAYGIGVSEVQETFRWLKTVESCDLDSSISKQSLAGVVKHLAKETSLIPEGPMTDYVILSDPGNMEAVATAYVLARFMISIIPEKGISPRLLSSDDDVSRRDSHLILLCTQNCLQSPHIARWMLQARMVPTCQLLPVLGDESFQVGKINEHLSPLSDLPDVDHNAYSQVIKATFLELAVPFICSQSSEDDLGIRSRQVVARLYGQLKRLNTKLLMVGTDVTSIEVHVPDLEHDQTSTESSNASIRMLNAAHRTNSIEDIMKSETISRAF